MKKLIFMLTISVSQLFASNVLTLEKNIFVADKSNIEIVLEDKLGGNLNELHVVVKGKKDLVIYASSFKMLKKAAARIEDHIESIDDNSIILNLRNIGTRIDGFKNRYNPVTHLIDQIQGESDYIESQRRIISKLEN